MKASASKQTTTSKERSARLARIVRMRGIGPLLLALFFIGAALVMLWPLPSHAGSSVQDLGDPLYQIWVMRSAQRQIIADPRHLWDGNTGYPFADSLLFSEPSLSTAVIAWPLRLISGNEVLAYNLMLIGTYVAVGLGIALLIWEITGVAGAGMLSGFAAAFVPYRYGHLSHLNLLSYGWTPLALWAIARYFRRRTVGDVLLAAIFLIIQVLASDTLAVMAGLLAGSMIVMLLWTERKRITPKLLAGAAIILGLPALAELPIALARIRVDQKYDFHRDLSTIEKMSATLQSYVSINPGNHLWWSILPHAYPNPLFPGLVASLGALVGMIFAWRSWPRWTIYFALLTLVGMTLSLGPTTHIGGNSYHLPYYLLYHFVPGFTAMRDAARFGMLALLGIEMLAGLGFAAAWKALKPRLPERWSATVAPVLVTLLLLGTGIELRNTTGAVEVPRDADTLAPYNWLAKQPPGPVIELPMNGLFTDVLQTTQQIYYSTYHWNRVIAAYASFVPQRDVDLLVALNEGPKTPSVINAANIGYLQDLGVRYVIIHHWPTYDWHHAVAEAAHVPELHLVGDMGSSTVYTIAPGNRAPVTYELHAPSAANTGAPVVVDFVTRNDNPTPAISWLQSDSGFNATWRATGGSTVEEVDLPMHLDVTANPGLTIDPLTLAAPRTPGRYQLTLSSPGVLKPLVQTIDVHAAPVANASAPPFTLRALTWGTKAYRPGDWVEVQAEWSVNQAFDRPLTATLQLQNSDNQTIVQWDGPPFGDALPTDQWQPGATIVQPMIIRIPPGAAPGALHLMLALYDHNTPDLARQTIGLPNGQSAPQYVSAAIPIAP
ncbi:MAG TPA: hypothetical protein VF201_11245 [Nitrolancea sp.]